VNDHLRNEIYLFLDSNLIHKEIPPEEMVSSLASIFELSGFDAMMVYADWTFNLIPKDDELMELEEELDKESLEWERKDSENE